MTDDMLARSTWRDRVERVIHFLCIAMSSIGALALAGMFALVLAAVVMRYVWNQPFDFTEELCGLFMTLAVFTLMPITIFKNNNIRVTVISELTNGIVQKLLMVLGQLILWIFLYIFIREAWGISEFTRMLGLKTEQSRLPLAPFFTVACAALFLVALVSIWRTFHLIQTAPSDEVHP